MSRFFTAPCPCCGWVMLFHKRDRAMRVNCQRLGCETLFDTTVTETETPGIYAVTFAHVETEQQAAMATR